MTLEGATIAIIKPIARGGQNAVPRPNRRSRVTVQEYLAREEGASQRHEYVDGRLFAMTGASRGHNIIAINILSILRAHIRGSHCRAYMSDVKVRVEATNSFYYPDVMVSCDKFDARSVYTTSPVLIAEVLSPSTATIDRREKVLAYRQIESLGEYLIVYQRKKQAELHRRNEQGSWDILEFAQGEQLQLESLPTGPLKFSIDEVSEDVGWTDNQDWKIHEEADRQYLDEEAIEW